MYTMSSEQILQQLIAGNQRYVDGRAENPNQTPQARQEVAQEQNPMAAILACADSRVPPEIVFDQGLGDLFVIRVAGHIAARAVVASVEFATGNLGVPLVVVLGHSNCGAVTAAVQGIDAPGQLGGLIAAIRPAVERVDTEPGDPVENAIRANVALVVESLRAAEPVLNRLVDEEQVRIIGAYYHLESGIVEFSAADLELKD